ncbi:MAG: alanine--tRNA ligase [Candidatus Pacebacteria bacterium]|nr:alanine--tRNA ligase [Candidatus Paceibacterota bacterium]
MNSAEIRSRFLAFFEKRGHTIIPSASLVTTDEKGITNPTLFNTAGMQPLIPYLLGEPYMKDGNTITRLVDAQKCVRTVDIDDIGDKTHATFFEMLGNWSLGDYFKKEAIEWSFEFLTSKEEGLGLDPNRLYISVFEGDAVAPRDEEAANIWRDVFKKNRIDSGGDTSVGEAGRIFYLPAKNNWWEAGENGPCGPDTEMFYDVENKFNGKLLTHAEYVAADDVRDVLEVWNDVFMQYEKKDGKIIGKLPKPSVDTGAGLERLTMTLQGVDNIYDTDLLKPVMDKIKELSKNLEIKSARIVADHIKAAVHLIADGVLPSNTDRGYVLRKLIRRAVRHSDTIKMSSDLVDIAKQIQAQYSKLYPNVMGIEGGVDVIGTIKKEELKFRETLAHGLKEFEKIALKDISAHDAFSLFSSYGFPIELTIELAKEKGIKVDVAGFDAEFKKHQDLSRSGAEQKFKGGLADANDPMVLRYHTATHLLHQALHDVLGEGTGDQKGSNITAERLRFDFTGVKLTDEQKKRVEDIVNEKIAEKLPMSQIIMPKAEAEQTGARHFFGEKYGDDISIYFIGPIAGSAPAKSDLARAYSKEFCGGPHVANTDELAGPEGKWKFKIQKEEASSQGVRRIKAVLS